MEHIEIKNKGRGRGEEKRNNNCRMSGVIKKIKQIKGFFLIQNEGKLLCGTEEGMQLKKIKGWRTWWRAEGYYFREDVGGKGELVETMLEDKEKRRKTFRGRK